MNYLPWIAGGAVAGYLHRKGPRGLRDGEGIPPAQLDLSTITLGPWTAVPVPEQKEDRWGGTTKLWNVVGPQKGFSLWRYWPKAWGVNLGGDYRLFLKKGRSYVGYMLLDEVRHQGESAWVVTQSSLEKGYRGVGLGSLMYLASRNLLEAYQGGPVKFIPTEDYLGGTSGGTSPMAQKVWKRLRAEGRLAKFSPEEAGKRLKKWLSSDEAYALLDSYPSVAGGTWTAGGCRPLAQALLRVLPGSTPWAVHDAFQNQHAVVEWQGWFFDGDGASRRRTILSRQREEGVASPQLSPENPRLWRQEGGTHCPVGLVRDLEKRLRVVLRGEGRLNRISRGGLRRGRGPR